jgi:hypothetical protein
MIDLRTGWVYTIRQLSSFRRVSLIHLTGEL